MNTAILFVGHGSRRAEADIELRQFLDEYRSFQKNTPIYHGYLELAEPNYQDVLADLATRYERITVIPLALFTAGHIKNDIPLAISRVKSRYPQLKVKVSQPFGTDPLWIDAVQKMLAPYRPFAEDETVLLAIGRGSNDPDANSDFFKISRLIGEGVGLRTVLPCFVGITQPQVASTLQILARIRPKRVFVLPYFIFTGVLLERIQSTMAEFSRQYSWIRYTMLPHLASSSELFQILHNRIDPGLKSPPLPCVSCQYRIPLGRLQKQVGGLNSLLWSVRHSFTHSQAMPHTHAHQNFKKHVLVCTNTDCLDRGALALIRTLRAELGQAGQGKQFRVTRTSCMGRCGEGPTVAVYPDGVWYRSMTADGAKRLVHEHLLNEKLVSEYIDNIM